MANETILLLFGLGLGAIYALLVLGLVLTYRMSRFLNLAHGAMGMIVTYVYWQMATDWGWNRWLSLATALLVVAPALGIVVGRLLFRTLLERDDSAKIAGSVVVVLGLTELAGKVWGSAGGKLPKILPAGAIRVGDAFFGWDRTSIILVAAASSVAVGVLLTRTRLGAEMRAVAESRSVAGLFGVDVNRVEMIGWAMATSLAALAGILISSLGSLNSFQLTFLVISALAAAAVGRLTSIPGAVAGAVLLGVVQSEMSRLPADFVRRFGSLPAAAPFLLLVAALVVLIRIGRDVGDGDVDQTAGRVGVTPRQSGTLRLGVALRRLRHRRAYVSRAAWLALAMAVTAGAALLVAGALGAGWLFLVTTGAIWTVAFSSVSLLNGLGGQVSLCQASFMGVGALVAARFQQTCSTNPINGRTECVPLEQGWRVWGAYLLAMAVAGVVGVVVAAGASRVRGVMLAVVTLSFGFFLDQTLFPSRDIAGGEFGYRMQRPAGFEGPTAFWVLCAVAAVLSVVLVRNLARSGTGRVLRLVEQSPPAAAAYGFATALYKVSVFGVSASLAGLAGALYASLLLSFQGTNYSSFASLLLFVVIYAVGTRRTLAPVVAGAAYILVPKLLSYWSPIEGYGNLAFALGALATLGLPGGLLGWLALRRDRAAAREAVRTRPFTADAPRPALPKTVAPQRDEEPAPAGG